MQITINQSEIESAITAYITNILGKLNPGTKIQIELKATRGAEGATAIIDLIPDGQAITAMPEPKKKEVAEAIQEVKATSAKLFQTPPAPTEPAMTEEQQLAVADGPVTTSVEMPAELLQVEVPVVPARTSLFAGLKKPVNA